MKGYSGASLLESEEYYVHKYVVELSDDPQLSFRTPESVWSSLSEGYKGPDAKRFNIPVMSSRNSLALFLARQLRTNNLDINLYIENPDDDKRGCIGLSFDDQSPSEIYFSKLFHMLNRILPPAMTLPDFAKENPERSPIYSEMFKVEEFLILFNGEIYHIDCFMRKFVLEHRKFYIGNFIQYTL